MPSVNWALIILIMTMTAGVNNGYWLTMLGITYQSGNMFINGIILGVSEMTAGIVSGILISLTNSITAFQLLALMGISFNAIQQFWLNDGNFVTYVMLFFAIQGVGGVYTCIYVIIGEKVHVTQVGGVMAWFVTVAVTAAIGAPLVVLSHKPIPYIVLGSCLSLSLIASCFINWAKRREKTFPVLNEMWGNET